jgi:hypothetical protein
VITTARGEASAFQRFHAGYDATIEHEAGHRALDRPERCVRFEQCADGTPIEAAVTLRARSPDCRALAAIQHPELQAGQVSGPCHDAAECIDLANHRTFGHAADGRVARHLADGFERARDQTRARAASRRGDGCLGAGVAGSDDEHVEVILEGHEACGHARKIAFTDHRVRSVQ